MLKTSLKTFAFGLALLLSTGAHAQEVVTVCGTHVSNGVLAADLDCSGESTGVIVDEGGTFNLAGFTLTGGDAAAIACLSDCTIAGSGGAITGARNGIQGGGKRSSTVTVSNLEISDSSLDGVWSNNANVTNCVIQGSDRAGVLAWVKNASVSGSTISGNSVGVASRRFASVTGSTISQNESGIQAHIRATIADSAIIDNANTGTHSREVRATNSSVQNNGIVCNTAPDCFDIGASRMPRLETVVCGTSARLDGQTNTGEDWDVCAFD